MPQMINRLTKPVFVSSQVVHGFGRGSKKLGVPTANLQDDVVQQVKLDSGIYYGFAQLIHPAGSNLPKFTESHYTVTLSTNLENPIYPAVFSLGWNPHFDDVTKRSLEAHLLHSFDYDFYDSFIRIAICGYIRPECKFDSIQELIDTIHNDIALAREALKHPERDWYDITHDQFFHIV